MKVIIQSDIGGVSDSDYQNALAIMDKFETGRTGWQTLEAYERQKNKKKGVNEFAPEEPGDRGEGDKPQFMTWEDFVAAVANLTKSAFDVKIGFKNKKLNKTQAAAKFIPHDPYEFGPVSLYAFKDRRPPYRVGVRAHMQVGTYSKFKDQILTQYKIPQNSLREVLMTPENATRIAHAIMNNKSGALTEAMWPFKKKEKQPEIAAPKRWPDRDDDLEQWMRDKIAFYKSKGWDPARLFSPATGDYFPVYFATGFSYNDAAKQAYRNIKREFPELVKRAREEVSTPLAMRVSQSRVGDHDDWPENTPPIRESSGHIPKNEKEAHDPRWSNALTVDIGPGEDKKQAAKFGFKVSNSGPPKMRADGKF